jgi:hypothetical protein
MSRLVRLVAMFVAVAASVGAVTPAIAAPGRMDRTR